MLGDVNDDGFIDAVDATAVRTEYAKISAYKESDFETSQIISADVNNDGYFDSVDATIISKYYAYISAHDDIGFVEYLSSDF
ncbi:MAG: hypothetical protein K2G14_07805 [Ruminococcus sp.]|nr:hypothetical protein [Ruminococcus sp.]